MVRIKNWKSALDGLLIFLISLPFIGAISFFYVGFQINDADFSSLNFMFGFLYLCFGSFLLFRARIEKKRDFLSIILENGDIDRLGSIEKIIKETIQSSLYTFEKNISINENAKLKNITTDGIEWTLEESKINIFYKVWSHKSIKLCIHPTNHEQAEDIKQKIYEDLGKSIKI